MSSDILLSRTCAWIQGSWEGGGSEVSTLFRRRGLDLLRLLERAGRSFLQGGAAPNALAGLQEFRPDVVEQPLDLGNVKTHDADGFELAGQRMNAHSPDHS